MCPRQFPASEENALFSTTYVSSRWRDPVATCSALWNPEALASYNFIYSRFPPTARSGPSSPSRARLSSSQGDSRQVQGGAISQNAVSGQCTRSPLSAKCRGQPNLCENRARVLQEQSKPLMSCSVATVRTERSYCLLRERVRNLHNLLSDILN